ncbi:MAG: hypothetical protein WBR33_18655 [Pseudonocardiaceae bacterium]
MSTPRVIGLVTVGNQQSDDAPFWFWGATAPASARAKLLRLVRVRAAL